MIIDFEVSLEWDVPPSEGSATPTEDDIRQAIIDWLTNHPDECESPTRVNVEAL